MTRQPIAIVVLMLVLAAGARADAEAPGWRPAAGIPERGALVAAAFDTDRGRLALADARGVWWGEPGGAFRRAPLREPVRDLAFTRDGSLLVASERGLFVWREGEALRERSSGPGAAARRVHRVVTLDGWIAIASDAGAWVTRDLALWTRVSEAVPSGPAAAVALRELAADAAELWMLIGQEVWRCVLHRNGPGLRLDPPRRAFARPGQDAGEPGDLLLLPEPGGAVVLSDNRLWLRAGEPEEWRVLRPAWPPGARARRIFRARQRWWVASDRGLLVASDPAGPWSRTAEPVGSLGVSQLLEAPGGLLAATEDGLHESVDADAQRPSAREAARLERRPLSSPPAADPGPEAVRRAVVAYLDLGAGRLRSLRDAVERRGWLPVLDLRLGTARDRHSTRDLDESFVSGATRRLLDRERESERGYEAGLTLRWDLGDVVYHPEAIDVSRETRELIELRDDILDEVTQLYFERQRVLLDLHLGVPGTLAERERLRLRAEELAAGLDAWTGGWFSRQLEPLP